MFAMLLILAAGAPQQPTAVADAVAPVLRPLPATDVHLDGWFGARVLGNRSGWLLHADLPSRLEPFVHRPARQAWAGEHLGKWLAAAALAAADADDAQLQHRMDDAVAALLATQEDDGYLGAYLPAQRFQLLDGADWDVWTIKYVLLGLLAYHRQSGEQAPLLACRRAADQLLATFGPGKRSILAAGTHLGMAATSVLEPMVQLWRATGERRYLEFARYLVLAWDEPGGPGIASALRRHGSVARTANGKAYEMLSNLVGLCELYRATGEAGLLAPVLAAFDDVVQNELLPSGSMSSHEHFVGGGRLPSAPGANLAETCVTVTWLQLDAQLLQITGEQRFGAEIERSASNHLLAAQQPDGSAFCYYTALSGRKPYDRGITCCSSSGPRGLAMLPQQAVFTSGAAELAVNLLAAAHGSAVLDGHRVSFAVRSELPRHGLLRLEFGGELPATFALRLRLSDWALPATLRCGGEQRTVTAAGWCTIPARAWSPGESLQLLVRCGPTVVADAHDPDRLALQWGPCLLALPLAPDLRTAERVSLRAPNGKLLGGDAVKIAVELDRDGSSEVVTMVPFADAGADGMPFRVWLANAAIPVARVRASAQSRNGNVDGSIRDGDRDSFTVTWDGKAAAEDWYELQLPAPVALQRLSYAHGHCFHDGGWFDASKGKPKLQVQDRAGAAWRTVGALRNYPNTTATDHRGLRDGDVFVLELPEPVTAVAVRVVGVPACGDAPQQAFSSCAELQALQR